MNDQPPQPEGPQLPPPGASAEGAQQMTPEQEEMLRQMEEEMRQVRVQDVITQSVVSILNLAARRIAKEDERDLEQAQVGIDAVRSLVDLLEEKPQEEVRKALSQVQMMYAQHAAGGGPAEGGQPGGASGGGESPGGGEQKPGGGRASGLWVPGD